MRDEDALFIDAARRAWSYVDRHYEPATGFVWTVPDYPITTLWDIASGLAALYCAEALGLLDAREYDARMTRALLTLRSMPLFDGAAFNKAYLVGDARMADRTGAASAHGYGWSAMDLGRQRPGSQLARLPPGRRPGVGEVRSGVDRPVETAFAAEKDLGLDRGTDRHPRVVGARGDEDVAEEP